MKTAQKFLDVLEKDKASTAKREISKILPVAQYDPPLCGQLELTCETAMMKI